MSTIFHIADTHIGAPFESLPPEAGKACRESLMNALTKAIDHANDLGASVILIPGDLFDNPDAPLSVFSRTIDILSRALCPVLISPGNHDYLHPSSPYRIAPLPPNVHIFSGTSLEPFALSDGTIIWGAAFFDMTAHIPLQVPLDPQKINILCVHADLECTSSYNPVRSAELAQSGFDYAAFGHNHNCTSLRRAGNTYFACPGSFVGRGPNEPGERGYLYGTVVKGMADIHFKPSEGVLFETIVQDMTAVSDDRTLSRAIASRIPAEHNHTCLTLELLGERSYTPDLAGLQRALSKIYIHAALRDRTTVTLDPWRYEEEDGLRGAVTRRFRKLYTEEQDADKRALHMQALKIALAALDGAERPK